MYIEYDKDYLEELYNDGKCKNKKYRFQNEQNNDTSWRCIKRRVGSKGNLSEEIL